MSLQQAITDPAPVTVPGRRTAWRPLANWALAAALLIAILWMIPAREISASLREVRIAPLIAAAVLALLVHLLQAVRLHRLARPLGLIWRFPKVLAIHFASLAYALVLPGGNMTGAAVRFYKFTRRDQDAAAAGVMLLVDRLVATMMLGITGLVCFQAAQLNVSGWLPVLFAMVVIATAGALFPIVTGLQDLSILTKLAEWPVVGGIAQKLGRTKRIPAGAICVTSMLAILVHALGIAAFLMAARSLGIWLDFWEVGLARAVMLVAILLPVSVAGLGLREGAAVLILARMGESEGVAFTFSLLVFLLISLLPGLIGAVIEVGHRRR